jgi:hypothetical protein
MPQFVATSCWSIDQGDKGKDFQVTLRIHLPGGQLMPESASLKVNFSTDRNRHRVFQYVRGIHLERPGDLVIDVLLDGVPCASRTISIRGRDTE